MKKTVLTAIYLVFSATILFAQTIIPPTQRSPISFGIFIDTEAFLFAEREVLAYRDLLESEGRSVYIVHYTWTNPGQVREEINNIYRSESAILEGVVLVGNIPIVLVRDFQHATTAFKACYRNPWWTQYPRSLRSPFAHTSVPSDRFFDDPYLQFRFLFQDEDNPLHFYYSLLGTSRQTLNSPFFSARILPPSDRGQNRLEYIRDFFTKVVRERQISNPLDNIVMFNGPSYNSDCLTAWFWMQVAHKEHFPKAFQYASNARFLNFRTFPYYKFNLFNELQREEVDVFMFHKHGGARWQLISNGTPGQEDSLSRANRRIWVEDIANIRANPRFILLDACNNGEFTLPGYVAGYYIFNEGRTLVTHANSVNVLQDKWTEAHLGLLSLGVTVGEWSRLTTTLEAHVFGDPTLRFTSDEFPTLHQDLILRRNDVQLWETYLQSGNPAVMAVALRHLYENNVPNLSDRLVELFMTSPFHTVRKQALHLLSRYNDENFVAVLQLALYDPYEMIRRRASIYIRESGHLEVIPAMIDVFLNDPHAIRVNWTLGRSFYMFPYENLVAELNRQLENSTLFNKEQARERTLRMFEIGRTTRTQIVETIMDNNAEHSARRTAITRLRNSMFHEHAPQFITMLADTSNDLDLRITMAEALGWFKLSYQNPVIAAGVQNVLADAKNATVSPEDEPLKERFIDELTKTINRLTGK